MFVKKIALKNFKSFKNATIELDKGFNVLVGPNGSGKSVRFDTKVNLSNGDVRQIGELVESALAASANVIELEDGLMTLENPLGIKVFTVNKKTLKIEERKVSSFIARKGEKQLYSITTKNGNRIVATGCHPIMVYNGYELVPLNAEKIKKGMKTVSASPSPNNKGTVSITLAWDEVASVEKAPGEEWVYDLCVEGNHNFLAEGIFVHNSNVIDSLLFAFGDSSLKSMRVKKTPDLIFGDHGVAEVAVDLSDGSAGIHSIRRMVRRDGKTKYYMDGKRARKYAVEDFLASRAVSIANIIKQGEVQRIVEMNSRDRRALIDAVANVSEYERKKTEAFSELAKVDEKLGEATAVLGEREGYLRELEKEKEDAERYLALKRELDSLKATLLSIDAGQLEKEFEEIIGSLAEKNSKLSEIGEKIRELEERIAAVVEEKQGVNREILARGEGKQLELQREIDSLASSIEFAEKTIEEKKAVAKKAGEKLSQLELQRKRSEDEVKGAVARMAEAEAELREVEKQLAEAEKEHAELTRASSEFSAQYYQAKQALQKCEEEMLECKEQLSDLQAKASGLGESVRLKEEQLKKLRQGVFDEGFGEKKRELEEKERSLRKAIEEIGKEVGELLEKEKELNQRLPAVEDFLLAAREKKAELAARLKHVHDAQEKAVGALRGRRGVFGTLEELCSYEPSHAVPVQVGLGPRMGFVVVDSVNTASECIELLKEKKLGRASFIPLDRIRAQKPGEEAKKLSASKGCIGFLIDFIKFGGRFEKAFRHACGDTLLMDSLKSMAPLVGRIRMVSMDGELAEGSGLLTGGTIPERASAARDKALLAEWEQKVAAAADERKKALEELGALREQISGARRRKAEADVALKAVEIELNHLRAEEEKIIAAKKNTSAAIKALEAEISGARKQIEAAEEERARLIRRLSDLNIQALDARQKIDVEKERNFGVTLKEKEKRISDLRITRSDYSNRLHALGVQKSVYEKQANALLDEEKELRHAIAEAREAVRKAAEDERNWRALLEQKTSEQKTISATLRELVEKREELDKRVQELGNEKGRLEFERERVQGTAHKHEVRKAALEASLASLKAELAACEGAVIEGKTAKDKPAMLARASELNSAIQAIGNVNMLAIELYAKRSQDLGEQKKKVQRLVEEKQAVLNIISEIEEKKISTFMAAFNAVNENFQKLFSQVFQGKGQLFLENPQNPFEGGLTIEVRLENKEVKYLEVMSGGEKSLIALMFLFAIQAHNPSSIYVLDEADAALDAENSRKLAQLLKQLSRDSQFLVVSHNEALLKNADCLIGVAMTRDGSKLVEVKLMQ